jgi:hypothetical protein
MELRKQTAYAENNFWACAVFYVVSKRLEAINLVK